MTVAPSKDFKTLLQNSYKSKDTEENIDKYFTRPVGLVFALFWKALGVHPTFITIMSIMLGIAAGWMFSFTDFWHNVYGILLLVFANICSSTDGQLARLTGKTSILGKMLDSAAPDVWFISIYIGLATRLQNQTIPGIETTWGISIWMLVAIAAVMAHARQARLADYYRGIHRFFQLGKGRQDFNTYEHLNALYLKYKKEGNWVGILFYSNYARYCKAQEAMTPEFQRLRQKLTERYGSMEEVSPVFRKAFRKMSLPLMKYCNFLSLNWRMLVLFVSCLAHKPWIYPLFEVTVMVAVHVYLLRTHETISSRFAAQLTRDMTPNANIKGLLIDFSGTLDTSGRHWSKMLWKAYQDEGVPISHGEFMNAFLAVEQRLGNENIIKSSFTFRQMLQTKIEMELAELNKQNILSYSADDIYQHSTKMVTALYEDVCHNIAANTKRLKTLKEAGMPIVLVANFYGNLKTVIQEFGIDQYFDDVVESEYVKVRKPDPMIFNMGIDALKINQPGIQPNEVCVVGDSDKNDIKPASELGCKTIKIETPTSFRKVLRLVGKAK